jgi:hypothetical protein
MTEHRPQRRGWRASAMARPAIIVGTSLAAALGASAFAGTATASATHQAVDTHSYRHGAFPSLSYLRTHHESPASATQMKYGGGIGGVGVSVGHAKVYLVFYGSQWGTQTVNAKGYDKYSGDPKKIAIDLQKFFKGLGSDSELWSGIATQYCQGVATGTIICPTSNTQRPAYPVGGVLAGVWEDSSGASPAAASAHQLAAEAEKAATHFGNTTAASNLNTQYVIVSPHGTNPDNYKTGGFCAWHDYTGDSSMDGGGAVSGPSLSFTNLPYIPDAGANCGAGFVNAGNVLDGVTIVEGHEYNEALTDFFPAGGYTNSSGAEVGDVCAWLSTGAGKSFDLKLSTGTFAVQGIYSNIANSNAGGCVDSSPVQT